MKSLLPLCLALVLGVPTAVLAQDPIWDLQEKLKSGQSKLEFDQKNGYLPSLLRNLNVPASSQTLVFSKTSLQSESISPKTPRALYFNDDVYVAWVQGSVGIEIMSVDPKRGATFYALAQENDGKPSFEHVTGHVCSVCHFSQEFKTFVPRLMFSSVIPDEKGDVEGAYPIPTFDGSPMEERWGGWYVTGTHGSQRHLGNVTLKTPLSPLADVSKVDVSKSMNLTDLSKLFDTSKYLSPGSDIVALMVLAHQVDVQNLITLAAAKNLAEPREVAEPLVKALLFSGAVLLKEPVKGSSSFAADFSSRGPKDAFGRSLRDFDLNSRLFKYPLSYMIYNRTFDELPEPTKNYVYRRLTEILTGKDQSKDFAHLSTADRTAILEILRETKRDFPR